MNIFRNIQLPDGSLDFIRLEILLCIALAMDRVANNTNIVVI